MPSPFGTIWPPRSIARVRPRVSTLKSRPVFDWTITSVLPSGVASMPLTLKPAW
jgi:hypothetical protein